MTTPPPTPAGVATPSQATVATRLAEAPGDTPTLVSTVPGIMLDVSRLPPEQAVAKLIERAVGMHASDIFFAVNEQHVAVHIRHLGMMQPLSVLSAEDGLRCMSMIRAQAGISLTENRHPLDGRWIYEKSDGTSVDLRINVMPTLHGNDMAIRMLDRSSSLYDIEHLGLSPEQLDLLKSMLASPSGLILISGPTGAGKTATQYGSVMKLRNGQRKINTIEDPIEFAVDGVRQSQVNPGVGLGFGELLRAVLRQSPDVIMIGEIRDVETAQTATYAANSGMLVMATLHAPSPAAAIQSMRSLGVQPHFLASSLRGVLSQRLVRTLCTQCRVPFDLADAPHTFDDVRPWLKKDEGKILYAPGQCANCNFTGYAGRAGVFEIMPVNKAIRDMIAENAHARLIRERALADGMLSFRQAALIKVARGETSTEEVFRVIPPEHLMTDE